TGLDLQKVFRPVKMEMKHPSYHLMTDEQLFEQKKPTGQMLQIVPVLPERKPVCDILAVDITFNVPHRERFIVTREPDGTLCKATCVERDWMVQIYFPYKGRQLTAPAVFEEGLRRPIVHEVILNYRSRRIIHHLTYENIDQHGNCDLLCSTHHFGRMVWYLGSKIRIDGLIIDMILRGLIHDAESAVELYHMMYSQFQSVKEATVQQASRIDLLKVRCILFYLVVYCVTGCYEILKHNSVFEHLHM
uniref:Mitochondrial ribosomal protein S22 n=1 Tax=Erpetoichthys calabaricus TaxID=27687 RepID=A0A8C4RZ28_ERPCA